MHAVSQLNHQLTHIQHHLSLHNNNQNNTSSHHHPLFFSSNAIISTPPPSPPQIPTLHASFLYVSRSDPSPLLIRTSACQHQNQTAMIRSLPCKVLFLNMQGSVPCRARFCSMQVMIGSLSCRFRLSHARFGSLTCKVLFLVVQGSVPSCHDPFLCMSSSVPYP